MGSNIKESQNIQELLSQIREQPLIYIGWPSIIKLKCFLDGYLLARGEIRGDLDSFGNMNEFQEMLQGRFETGAAYSWDRIIEFCAHGDREGFKSFWEMWDRYLANPEERYGQKENFE